MPGYLGLLVLLAAAQAVPAPGEVPANMGGNDVRIAPDGMLLVNGKRTFMIGCYWHPSDEKTLAEMKNAGFNLILCRADAKSLDEAAHHGLLAWVPLGGTLVVPEGDKEEEGKLRAAVQALKDHPALAVWEVPDEALWNVWHSRLQALSAERSRILELLRGKEAAGEDVAQARARFDDALAAFRRAEYDEAERLDREARSLLGAPPQRPEIQLSTAPEAAEAMRRSLLRGYRIVHQADGHHPVWMNHAPRNTMEDLRRYAEAADIVGCDIYPVPERPNQGHSDLESTRLSCVGDYTDRMALAGQGRPVWMVLQGFGWRDLNPVPPEDTDTGRRPTRAETRFMIYDAIAHGSRGVLYWGTNYAQKPPELWRDLLAVVREVADLRDVLSAPDAPEQPRISFAPTWGSVDRRPRVLAKAHGGRCVLFIINEWSDPLRLRIQGLGVADGRTLRDIHRGTDFRVRDGAVEVPIPAMSPRILREE